MAILTPGTMVRNNVVQVFNSSAATTAKDVTRYVMAGGGQILDAGSTRIATIQYDKDDKIGFIVTFACTAAAASQTLTVAQGTARRAWQRDLGSLTLSLNPTTGWTGRKSWFVGPFETARFAQRSTAVALAPVGRNYVRFTLSTASTVGGRYVRLDAFRMPDVQYAT